MDISSSDMRELVRSVLTREQVERSLVYWYKKTLHERQAIDIGAQTVAMPFEGMLVFVDLAPRSNWAHPCLYILVDGQTRNTEVVRGSLPPDVDQCDESFVVLLRYGRTPAHER